jgi:flagellar protein FliO/FliZ
MTKVLVYIYILLSLLLTPLTYAQEADAVNDNAQLEDKAKQDTPLTIEKAPQVGKHVMANMDASSMILSLLMVLGLIVICAIVLKRFNLTQQHSSQIKVVANLSLGAKERIVVVQIGEQQLVLGVCPQQISLLKDLETPIDIQVGKSLALPGNVLSFLNKSSSESSNNSKQSTSETTRNN